MHNGDVPLDSKLNPDSSRRTMFLNAQISGILAATWKLTYDFAVHTTQDGLTK